MSIDQKSLQELATNIRVLSAEAVQAADSGHPGMPMGAADYAAVLWQHFLKFNPQDTNWWGRDRFVLSAGHGSMLLYSLLHLYGYDLPMDEIKKFRQWGSKTPGHPEFHMTPGVETTTGPLGAGFANGVGLALSAKMMAARYGSLFDYRVFGVVSDGDLMEGISYEAGSVAGHLKLNNLVYIYDDNHISIGGDTNICFSENVPARFEAQGWYVQSIDGHDYKQIHTAITNAIAENTRPSIICARTTIGKGSPAKCNTSDVHGSPLGEKELEATKQALGWTGGKFEVLNTVKTFCADAVSVKQKEYSAWQSEFETWKKSNSDSWSKLSCQLSKEVPDALKEELVNTFRNAPKGATRNISGQVIQVLAKHLPGFVGGSADLEPSTKTLIKGSSDITASSFEGKNLRFGIREHVMGSIANGMAYTGAWIPYTATFLVFADYMRPSLRLAAISELQTMFIFTHDSFWVGEDGPTHQPIEHIASLRAIPNLYVMRPADGLETAMCYLAAVRKQKSPSAMLFTRQDLAPIQREDSFDPETICRGAYVAYGADVNDLVIVASGSEVATCIESAKLLEASGRKVRVVSMPCMELFLDQNDQYRESVIPKNAKKVSVEAGSTMAWDAVVGDGLKIGKNTFGASAPGGLLAEKFGFIPKTIAEKITAWLN